MTDRTGDDLCTPSWILDRVRKMGPIALDPCGNPWSSVGAAVTISKHDGHDGLEYAWAGPSVRPGSIWVNPPYSKPGPWIDRIVAHPFERDIFALVKNDPSTRWFRKAMGAASARADFRKRIQFEGGAHKSGVFASTLFYFGPNPFLFAHLFQDVADVFVLKSAKASLTE